MVLSPVNGLAEAARRGSRPRSVSPTCRASGLASSGLVVLATLAVLQGYTRTGLIASAPWHPPALVFAVLALVSSLALTRPAHGRHRTRTEWPVVGAAVVVGVVTLVAMAVGRSMADLLLVSVDMLLAVTSLAVVALLVAVTGRSSSPSSEESVQAIG